MKYKKSYWLIGQKAIITNAKKEILLLRRSAKTSSSGRWDFVGGGLEQGEDPIKGIKREIKEEAGLTVSKVTPLILESHAEDKDHVVLIFYKAKSQSNKVKLSWEHDKYTWVSKKQALTMKLPPKMKQIVKLLS